jgi:hypothetical protein
MNVRVQCEVQIRIRTISTSGRMAVVYPPILSSSFSASISSFGCGPTAQPPDGKLGRIVPMIVAFRLPQIHGLSVVSVTSSKLNLHGLISLQRIIPGDFTVPLKRRNVMFTMLI